MDTGGGVKDMNYDFLIVAVKTLPYLWDQPISVVFKHCLSSLFSMKGFCSFQHWVAITPL